MTAMLGSSSKLWNKLRDFRHSLARIEWLAQDAYRRWLLDHTTKYAEPNCLIPHGYKVYSQNDEDGIIERIFALIGEGSRRFVEFGVEGGIENNSLYLLMKGWSGAWIEADPDHCRAIRTRFQNLIDDGRLAITKSMVDADNIESLFRTMGVPEELDLLSIDIDSNDFWVWQAVANYRPRVVVIEYNAGFGATAEWTLKYTPTYFWSKNTRNFGASLKALERLGREKGYSLVGCNIAGCNAFFVRDDQDLSGFQAPFTAEHHYEPPRNYMKFFTGNPVDAAEVQSFGAASRPRASR